MPTAPRRSKSRFIAKLLFLLPLSFFFSAELGASAIYTLPPAEDNLMFLTEEDEVRREEFGYEERGKGPEFSIGYERIPAEYLTPFARASWSWNPALNQWDIDGAYNTVQFRDDKSFPFIFAGFSRTKAVSPSFSAGFETGFYLPLSSSRDDWNLPFLSSSTSQSTAYNYEIEPSSYSALYNSDKRKMLVVPVMAVLAWDPPGFLNASLGAGFYITHLQIESVSGERFYADYTDSYGRAYSAGSVYEYSYWRSDNKIIPAVKCSLSARVRASENSGLKLSVAAVRLRKTDFLFRDYVFGGKTFRDGVVIGGLSYSFSAGWKILF